MGVVLKLEVTVLRGVPSKTLWRLSRRRRELVARLRHRWRPRVAKRTARVFTIATLRGAEPAMSFADSAVLAGAQDLVTFDQYDEITADATPANWDLANAIIAVEWEIRARQVAALERSLCWLAQQSTPGGTFDPADEDAVRELVRHAPDLALAGVLLAPQQDPTLSGPVA